jgi:hypothetical protein
VTPAQKAGRVSGEICRRCRNMPFAVVSTVVRSVTMPRHACLLRQASCQMLSKPSLCKLLSTALFQVRSVRFTVLLNDAAACSTSACLASPLLSIQHSVYYECLMKYTTCLFICLVWSAKTLVEHEGEMIPVYMKARRVQGEDQQGRHTQKHGLADVQRQALQGCLLSQQPSKQCLLLRGWGVQLRCFQRNMFDCFLIHSNQADEDAG